MDTNHSLNELKSIHLPNPISIFPLAIGWYILAIIFLIIIIGGIWWISKRIKKQKLIKNIYRMLSNIEQQNNSTTISEVSILLKRIAIMKFPEQQVHKLFDENWLIFLDTTGKTKNFTQGEGKALLNIYRNQPIENPDKFFSVIRDWLGVVL